MAEAPSRLRAQQNALTRHLRNPTACEPPTGWEPRRLGVYRELVFNNIEALLATNFPVMRTVLGETEWRALVRGFLCDHASGTPLFPEIGREMIAWLDTLEPLPRPFLRELAHYEWIELALQVADLPADVDTAVAEQTDDRAGDLRHLLDSVPVVSPLAWPVAYAWPVHRIDATFQPATVLPVPTLLLVRRDRHGAVRFSELSPLAYRLLERIAEAPALTGRQQLEALASEAGAPAIDAFIDAAAPLLRQLHETRVVLAAAADANLRPFQASPGAN